MQLIIATMQDRDADATLNVLTGNGQRLTRLSSSGSFLQQGNSTLLLGLGESLVPETLAVIQKHSRRRSMFVPSLIGGSDPVYGPADQVEVEIGGAVIFVLPIEQYEQI